MNAEALAMIDAALEHQAKELAAQNAIVEEMKHLEQCILYAARDYGMSQRQFDLLREKVQGHPYKRALLRELGWRLR